MIADLHVHTNESDGTWTPKQLVVEAARRSLAAIAITDHDTTAGIEEARRNAPDTLRIIPGVELSCSTPQAAEIHILGLWINEQTPSLQKQLELMRQSRLARMEKILERLHDLGIPMSPGEVTKFADKGVLSRSHIAAALVARGAVATKKEAFARYLDAGAPAYAPRYKLEPEAAVELITTAGGVPVLAHPGLLEDLIVLPRLVAAGLAGLEVVHPSHDAAQTRFFLGLAHDLELLPCGGSDCHGPGGKERVFLGEYTIPWEWVRALAPEHW